MGLRADEGAGACRSTRAGREAGRRGRSLIKTISNGRRFRRAVAITVGLALAGLLPGIVAPPRATAGASPQDALGARMASAPREEVVHFTSGAAAIEGTLFRPAGEAPWPAVVILAGSDRSARGPLRTRLARHLAARNVAALVYDSPGTGASTGSAVMQTRRERVDEALAAVAHVRGLPGIRPSAVGLLGGSEGADVALLAAARDPRLAFVIAVSSALDVSILDLLRYSAEKEGRRQGLTAEEIAKAITFKELAFVFLSGADLVEWPLLEARVGRWDDGAWRTLIDIARQRTTTADEQRRSGLLESFRGVIDHFRTRPWFKAADPAGATGALIGLDADDFFRLAGRRYATDWNRDLCALHAVRCPVLAIWGEEDSFLPPHQSAARLRRALAESAHPDYEIRIFTGASHFLTVPGSSGQFVAGYLDHITQWLDRRVDVAGDGGP